MWSTVLKSQSFHFSLWNDCISRLQNKIVNFVIYVLLLYIHKCLYIFGVSCKWNRLLVSFWFTAEISLYPSEKLSAKLVFKTCRMNTGSRCTALLTADINSTGSDAHPCCVLFLKIKPINHRSQKKDIFIFIFHSKWFIFLKHKATLRGVEILKRK